MAVLTCTHNLCFEKNKTQYHTFSSENFNFLQHSKSLWKDFKITNESGFFLIRGGIQANQVSYQSLISHHLFRIKLCMPWPEYNLSERFKAHKGLGLLLIRLDIRILEST